jgi:hypothetical protein
MDNYGCRTKSDELANAGRYDDALASFQTVWVLLPEPKDKQDLAVQILAGIADCQFSLGAWQKCREAVQHAFRCGADVGNPFLRLRLGQCLYELGNEHEAANWLVPVYLMEGKAPFEGEDPKYLNFFRAKLLPPEGGWPEGW